MKQAKPRLVIVGSRKQAPAYQFISVVVVVVVVESEKMMKNLTTTENRGKKNKCISRQFQEVTNRQYFVIA